MEREYSAQSLSSRGGSERESNSAMEMGVYMSSFTATVFISGLVTVGVSLMTLLIALTVMLQSCRAKNAGVVEMQKSAESFEYCRILALHVELNNLDTNSLPSVCKELAVQNIRDGHYMRELNNSLRIVENYFRRIEPREDGQDAVLMDVDDFFPPEYFSVDELLLRVDQTSNDSNKGARHLRPMIVQELFMKLRDGGWQLVLLSRKHERLRNRMVEYLISVGCGGWSSLTMRVDGEAQMDSQGYFLRRKSTIAEEGFRIIGTISSQLDFLTGPRMGGLNFKLPSIMLSNTMDHHAQN